MKKFASKQRFLATEELCPPSPCTPRHFPRKCLQRPLSTAQQNLSASTYPSQPLAFTVFTTEASTQVLAFTIFTPKSFPPMRAPVLHFNSLNRVNFTHPKRPQLQINPLLYRSQNPYCTAVFCTVPRNQFFSPVNIRAILSRSFAQSPATLNELRTTLHSAFPNPDTTAQSMSDKSHG
jgi:hypothetical protein